MSALNPALVAWNNANQLRRIAATAEFEANIEKPGVLAVTLLRQARHFASGPEGFRLASSLEHEARLVVEEISLLPPYISAKNNSKPKRLRVGTFKAGASSDGDKLRWLDFLAKFFRKPENLHAELHDIWQNLITYMLEHEFEPEVVVDPTNSRKTRLFFNYEMSGGGLGRHELSYGRFANLRSELRPKESRE